MFAMLTGRSSLKTGVYAARHLSVAMNDRRSSLWLAVLSAALPAVVVAQTPTTSLPGTLSGTSILLNASSGTVAITGNSTLSGTVTMDLAFGVEYLVVGGGGGSGGGGQANNNGGGGGGGGVVSGTTGFITASTVGVLVGNGGTAGTGGGNTDPAVNVAPTNGGNSGFSTVTALGGGGGGGGFGSAAYAASSGGSGGGGSLREPGTGSTSSQPGAAGTAGQGFGGGGASTVSSEYPSGGGGGAGQAGNTNGLGRGGDGIISLTTGSSVYYGGGGGGGSDLPVRAGGLGGGGSGGRGWPPGTDPTSGTANTGGGGGGGMSQGDFAGSNGGSGIVIARYLGTAFASGGDTVTSGSGSAAGYTLHTFTTTGSSSLVIPDVTSRLGATIAGELTGSGALVFEGPGTLTLSGSNSYTGATNVSAGTLLVAGALGNTAVGVALGGRFGGTGILGGDLSFATGSFLEIMNIADPLAVSGSTSFGSGFGIANLAGIDWDSLQLNTPYTVLSASQGFSDLDIANFGFDNRAGVGSIGRQAYFGTGSLTVVVVPEPGAIALAAIGIAAAAWAGRRRA